MDRFKMSFKNSGEVQPPQISNLGANIAAPPARVAAPVQKNGGLGAPMIDRVHKAKPGCSACGKKVS
jgi:hypothetical protein